MKKVFIVYFLYKIKDIINIQIYSLKKKPLIKLLEKICSICGRNIKVILCKDRKLSQRSLFWQNSSILRKESSIKHLS